MSLEKLRSSVATSLKSVMLQKGSGGMPFARGKATTYKLLLIIKNRMYKVTFTLEYKTHQ